jgi:hypothetical protein
MTTKQKYLYFTEWQKAKKAACQSGSDLKESDRHTLHIRALGQDKSSKDFTNEDLDKVLAEFRAISRPTSLNSQLRQIEQPRTRLLKKIVHLFNCVSVFVESDGEYITTILHQRFHVENIDDIAEMHILEQVRSTFTRIVSKLRQEYNLEKFGSINSPDRMTEHDMCARAGVPCLHTDCAECRSLKSPIAHRPSPIAH